jgi:alpha-1,2-mannosyltransferase
MTGLGATIRLALLLLMVLCINAVLMLASPPDHRETVLDHSRAMLRAEGGDDSWGVMNVALDHFAAQPAVPLYAELFFRRQFRFQYPPSSLFALMGLQLAGRENVRTMDGQHFAPWPAVNDMVGWLFLALTALASFAILEKRLASQTAFVDRTWLRALRLLLVLALAVTFYPLVKAYTLGQIQVWITGLMALALLCWLGRWPALGGVLVGLVCLIKPHYGLLVVWGLLRREWTFAAAAVLTGMVGLAAALAVFGLANQIDYLQVLQFLSQRGEAYYPNQSLNGLLNRWMSIRDARFITTDIPAGVFPPYTPWIHGATLASTGALSLYALIRRAPGEDRARDFARAILCCTLASPIAWEHHFGILLPIFALLLVERRTAWLILAFALTATYIAAAQLLDSTVWNPLQSYVLAGAAIVLVLLHAPPRRNLAATT